VTLTKACRCLRYWPDTTGRCRDCRHFAESHDPDTGACGVTMHMTRPLDVVSVTPIPDPDLPDPGIPESLSGPRLRLAHACWRYGVWDDRVREARAALQAAIDANGQGDAWWERHLTIAMGKRALWQNRIDRYSV
jgi:hypothetical protein